MEEPNKSEQQFFEDGTWIKTLETRTFKTVWTGDWRVVGKMQIRLDYKKRGDIASETRIIDVYRQLNDDDHIKYDDSEDVLTFIHELTRIY